MLHMNVLSAKYICLCENDKPGKHLSFFFNPTLMNSSIIVMFICIFCTVLGLLYLLIYLMDTLMNHICTFVRLI